MASSDFDGDLKICLSINRIELTIKIPEYCVAKALFYAYVEIWTLKNGKNLDEKPLKNGKN